MNSKSTEYNSAAIAEYVKGLFHVLLTPGCRLVVYSKQHISG